MKFIGLNCLNTNIMSLLRGHRKGRVRKIIKLIIRVELDKVRQLRIFIKKRKNNYKVN